MSNFREVFSKLGEVLPIRGGGKTRKIQVEKRYKEIYPRKKASPCGQQLQAANFVVAMSDCANYNNKFTIKVPVNWRLS